MMSKLLLILHTIIHLRPIQIRYQLWYRVRKMWRKISGFKYPISIRKEGYPLQFTSWIDKNKSLNENKFTFLNLSKSFEVSKIHWNEPQHGKLWTYNLNYMDYLLQADMDKETGMALIGYYIQNLNQYSEGLEPYPIALRSINWIKFISRHRHCEERPKGVTRQPYALNSIASSLFAQYQILLDNLEYHLLGNHLLEDGFSLLFGAFYFKDNTLYKKAKEIITVELEEQILGDGAHFELSPMYHQIILDRLLDCINLVQNNQRFVDQDKHLQFMRAKAKNMLRWLNNITFSNGESPLLNDSAPGIASTPKQLNAYATSLNFELETLNAELGSSGYRRFNGTNYECILDIGHIGPSYQPGHAHADTFAFVLNINNKPIFVDSGISTYEANKIRLSERGTAAHNTVTVSGANSSKIWSSFRVAQRAYVEVINDTENVITAKHNGYKKNETLHQREWNFDSKVLSISDSLIGKNRVGLAHFHFASGVNPFIENNRIHIEDTQIHFSQKNNIKLIKTSIPNGYNQHQENYKIEVLFNEQLTTTIKIC